MMEKMKKMAIISMVSSEQEEVSLMKPIEVNKGALRGCVEKWLSLLGELECLLI